jgi:hypothetical protein
MALSDRAREFWRRRGYETSAPNYDKGQAKEVSRIVIPAKTSLGESEAVSAEGVPNIPFSVYPTPTINPPRPRTIAAGYDEEHMILRLKFRPGASSESPSGAVYDYYGVTPAEWVGIRARVINSTGRYLNNQLSAKEYVRLY